METVRLRRRRVKDVDATLLILTTLCINALPERD